MPITRKIAPVLLAALTAAGALSAATATPLATDPLVQIIDEVPFVTTADNVTLEMLRLARVGAGDHVIDLGSGDGRIVVTAAQRFGATGFGVEVIPDLVERSRQAARAAGVADKARFAVQDLFETDLAPATVITMYLLPEFNLKLRPALLALRPGTRLVSHDWDMGEWKPDHTSVLPVPDKKVGLDKSSKVHLWIVPASVQGLWCGAGPLRGFSLQLQQRFQQVEGTLTRRARSRPITGRLDGATLQAQSPGTGALTLQADAKSLRITGGDGLLAMASGTSFTRAAGADCGAAASP